jgi:hypothetical protein
MLIFWVSILALSILLYGLLLEFDLGIAIIFGFAREKGKSCVKMSTVAPVSDRNEMWLIVVSDPRIWRLTRRARRRFRHPAALRNGRPAGNRTDVEIFAQNACSRESRSHRRWR